MSTQTKPMHVRQSVADAVKIWQRQQELAEPTDVEPVAYPPSQTILQSIPRREQLIPPDSSRLWMPYLEPLPFKKSFWRSLGRVFTWLNLISTIVLGGLLDRLLR